MINLFSQIKKKISTPKTKTKKVIRIQKDNGLFKEFLTLARTEMDKIIYLIGD